MVLQGGEVGLRSAVHMRRGLRVIIFARFVS